MVITDQKLRKAFRTDARPSSETQKILMEAVARKAAENENVKVETNITYQEKSSERGGRGLVLGLMAMAAVALLALIVFRLLPSLRSPSANDPGIDSEWEPAEEILVTGETDVSDEKSKTDEKDNKPEEEAAESEDGQEGKEAAGSEDGQEGKGAAGSEDDQEGKGAAGSEDGQEGKGAAGSELDPWQYALDDLIFTLPELWREKGVIVLQYEDRLTAVYRDIALCSLEIFSGEQLAENPIEMLMNGNTEFCPGTWDLTDGRTAALFVPNYVLNISSAGNIRQFVPASMLNISCTEDDVLGEILYLMTGEETDIAKIKARSTDPEAEADVRAALAAAEAYAYDVLAPAVHVNEDYAYTYRLGALSFVMPEIWREQGVEVIQEETWLKFMYRGLLLGTISLTNAGINVSGSPLHYSIGTWYLGNETIAVLSVNNWPMKIYSGPITVDYDYEGVVGTAYSSEEDMSDILYTITGQNLDAAQLYGMKDQSGSAESVEAASVEIIESAIAAEKAFFRETVIPAVHVDREAYTFRNESFTFTLPELWRAPGELLPYTNVTVEEKENELTVMYRGLRLCTIITSGDDPAGQSSNCYSVDTWDLGNGGKVTLWAESWVEDILTQGAIGPTSPLPDENQNSNTYTGYTYISDYDLQDILYMTTGKVWDVSEIQAFKGQAENPGMAGEVSRVRKAAGEFMREQVLSMIEALVNEYETDEYSFRMPEFWKEKGASFVMNENGLHVVYRGLTLCLLKLMPAEQAYWELVNAEDTSFVKAWEIGDGNAVVLYENSLPADDVWTHGWINTDIDPTGPAAVFSSDEDMADILYMLTGQQIDISKVKAQSGNTENPLAISDYYHLTAAAADYFNNYVVPAIKIKTPDTGSKYKTWYPSVQYSWYLKELLDAEPYAFAALSGSQEDHQIPEKDLQECTNEELILTVLDYYPYQAALRQASAYDNMVRIKLWGDSLMQRFNGFRELTEREDRDGIVTALRECFDFIVNEYGWIAPSGLLDYLERLITYLEEDMDVPLPTVS